MIQPNKGQGVVLKLTAVAVFLFALPASAQIPIVQEIYETTEAVIDWVSSLASGRNKDTSLGRDLEGKLLVLLARLEAQPHIDSYDDQELRGQLEAVRSELAILRTVLNDMPTTETLNVFALKLANDLVKLKKAQAETDAAQNAKLELQDAKIAGLEQRVGQLDSLRPAAPEPPSPGPDRSPERLRSQGTSDGAAITTRPQLHSPSVGVTLVINANGNSNQIRVQQVMSIGDADLGTFEISGTREFRDYYLLSGTGSVIILYGKDNTVQLQPLLCGRVRIVDRGQFNEKIGCK